MEISAIVLADSLSPCGARLTTMEWTYPRCIHSEIMTHRMLSKNSASSRAIPIDKMLKRIRDEPFIPKVWGRNQKGMQGGDELTGQDRRVAEHLWMEARESAIFRAKDLQDLGLHKQIVNRIVEPWMWITIIVSATSYDNVWGLRCHPDAEPHFQELAYKARDAMAASTPRELKAGEWHLPLIHEEDWIEAARRTEMEEDAVEILKKVSVGRCARVSYLTHDGKRDLQADIELHDRLVVQQPAHATPAEHVAQALDWPKWSGGFFVGDDVWWRKGSVYDLRNRVVEARRERQIKPELTMTKGEMGANTLLGDLASGNFLGFQQYRKLQVNEHIGGLMP